MTVYVADNSKALDWSNPNYDKLCKVCPLLNVVSKRSSELYNRCPQLSLVESIMIAISAVFHLYSVLYITKKRLKWEIEVWMCADSVNG